MSQPITYGNRRYIYSVPSNDPDNWTERLFQTFAALIDIDPNTPEAFEKALDAFVLKQQFHDAMARSGQLPSSFPSHGTEGNKSKGKPVTIHVQGPFFAEHVLNWPIQKAFLSRKEAVGREAVLVAIDMALQRAKDGLSVSG